MKDHWLALSHKYQACRKKKIPDISGLKPIIHEHKPLARTNWHSNKPLNIFLTETEATTHEILFAAQISTNSSHLPQLISVLQGTNITVHEPIPWYMRMSTKEGCDLGPHLLPYIYIYMSHFAYACKTEGISRLISALCVNCLSSIPEYSRLNHLDVYLV